MIGRLHGTLLRRALPLVVIDVGGVGYELTVSLNTLDQLPPEGEKVTLEVLTLWRNESLQLFGFLTGQEKALFATLNAVPGIGPRLGMALLSSLSVPDLVTAVREERAAVLQAVPGIGRKTAQRLILELRDRLGGWVTAPASGARKPAEGLDRDAESVLENLGYKSDEVRAVLERIPTEDRGSGLAALVRAALREMGARR